MPQLKKKTVNLQKKAKTSNGGQGTYIKKEAKNCEDCPHKPPQSITPSSSMHFSDLPKKQNRYTRHGKWIVTEKK